MENTLLVGLSRQMTLERQLDVVANNVANINTTGFKADRSLFEEYLRSPAHEDNFVRADRRVSFVQDRATFHDFAAGPSEQTKNPLDVAIDGNAFLVVQTAGRRALHPRRRPADQQSGPARDRERRSGAGHLRPDRVPADRQGRSTSQPTATSPCSKAPAAPTRSAASCGWSRFADAQKLVKEGGNLYSAGQGIAAQPDTTSRVRQGFIEKSNVNSVHEMSRMIEITRTYTQISAMLQQQHDLHRTAIEKLADVPA